MRELNEKTIVITRARHQANALIKKIEALDGTAIHFPTIAILPTQSPNKLQQVLQHFPGVDIAIFVSANAIPIAASVWHKAKSEISTIAIGPGTKKAAEKAQIHIDLLPSTFNSEGLLQLEVLQKISNKTIMLFTGEDARPLLEDTLRERGANVFAAECYRRALPTIDSAVIKRDLMESNIDCIVCMSPASLSNFVNLLSPDHLPFLLEKKLLVISAKMAEQAKSYGFTNIIIANDATDDAVIESLIFRLAEPTT